MSFRAVPALLLVALTLSLSPSAAAAAQASVGSGAVAPASDAADREHVPGEVLVTWHPSTPGQERAARARRHGLRRADAASPAGVERYVLEPGADPRRVAAGLRRRGEVAGAQPNYVYRPASDDPLYPQQWGLHNTGGLVGELLGVADVDLDAPEAWRVTTGSSSVTVAVIDTGVDVHHPDLRGKIRVNAAEQGGVPGVDDDGNGYVDDVHGWDFHGDDASVFDDAEVDAHGTHVAGIVAAAAGNGLGGAGVAPGVRVLPVKFLGSDGGTTADAIAAIEYATQRGAHVINASWGNQGASDPALERAVAASGAVLVAAAGNGGADEVGDDTDAEPQLPAGLPTDTVVSVAAVDHRGELAGFSNFGATTVDLGAPGVAIVSTVPEQGYAWADGTSMAAPMVAGVAALVRSAHPELPAAGVAGVLRDAAAATPLPSLAGRTATGGIVNAPRALQLAADIVADGGATDGPSPSGDDTEPAPWPATGGTRTLELACPDVAPDGDLGVGGYVDVPVGGVHAPGIACATTWGVFLGGGTSTFLPDEVLTRGQLASVVARTLSQVLGGEPTPTTDHFTDDGTSVHEDAIDVLADFGIVAGVADGRYAPAAAVTRGQFASMLARAHELLVGHNPLPADRFEDDDGSPHEDAIGVLTALGVVAGDGDGRFQPGATLTRAQSATMIARLLDALVAAGVAVAAP